MIVNKKSKDFSSREFVVRNLGCFDGIKPELKMHGGIEQTT